jgi:hypothetical protein
MMHKVDPNRALVISVGVERYRYGAQMDLPGAIKAAEGFAQWAMNCGVPRDRVWLACSQDGGSGLSLLAAVKKFGATYTELQDMLADASQTEGDLLLFFWCGHGILNNNRQRALFTSDAYAAVKRMFVIDELLHYLSSDKFSGLSQQVLFIDACANFVQDMNLDMNLNVSPQGHLDVGNPREISQFVFFSAGQGQIADFDRINRDARFSKILLDWLTEDQHIREGLPPQLDDLKSHIKRAFEALRKQGKLRQTPVTFSVKSDDGSEEEWQASEIPVSGASLEAIRAAGMTTFNTRRVVKAVTSLAPMPDVRNVLIESLTGECDGGSVANLGLQGLVARILQAKRTDRLFDLLMAEATTEKQRIEINEIRAVWERQERIAGVAELFSDVTTRQVIKAYSWAVPDIKVERPNDLDDAMDRAADHGLTVNGQLALHRFVAALEHVAHTEVPDSWFDLPADLLNALRADVANICNSFRRLVIEIPDGSQGSGKFQWPNKIGWRLYEPGRSWSSPIWKKCDASSRGVQAAINDLLEDEEPTCTLGFIMPRAAFDMIPESWTTFGTPYTDPTPYWHERPTVLHSAERFSSRPLRQRWAQKADDIKDRLDHHPPANLNWIELRESVNIRRAIIDTDSTCYGLAFVPGGFCGDLRQDPIIAAVAAGAPYVIWAQQEPNDWDAAKKKLEDLISAGDFDDLPSRLQRFRQAADADGLGGDRVRLIWDHPNAIPPTPELSGMGNGIANK